MSCSKLSPMATSRPTSPKNRLNGLKKTLLERLTAARVGNVLIRVVRALVRYWIARERNADQILQRLLEVWEFQSGKVRFGTDGQNHFAVLEIWSKSGCLVHSVRHDGLTAERTDEDTKRVERVMALRAIEALVSQGFWFSFMVPLTGLSNPGNNSSLCSTFQLFLSMDLFNVFVILEFVSSADTLHDNDLVHQYCKLIERMANLSMLQKAITGGKQMVTGLVLKPEDTDVETHFLQEISAIADNCYIVVQPGGGRSLTQTTNCFLYSFIESLKTNQMYNIVANLFSHNPILDLFAHNPILDFPLAIINGPEEWNRFNHEILVTPTDTQQNKELSALINPQTTWRSPDFDHKLYLMVNLNKQHHEHFEYMTRADRGYHTRVNGIEKIEVIHRLSDDRRKTTTRKVEYNLRAVSAHEKVRNLAYGVDRDHACGYRRNWINGKPTSGYTRLDDSDINHEHRWIEGVESRGQVLLFERQFNN